jgi:DNA-binding LacI/PurR family transcriptional regulator
MRPSLKDRGTLTDVAKAVGVSVASVSYAFSRPELLSTKLREKILATARSLNYPGPNPAARMLRTGFAGSIAVVYASPLYHVFQDPAAAAFLSGVAEACSERRLGLLLTRINRLPLDWPHDRRNSITGIALGFVIYWNHRIRESLASV